MKNALKGKSISFEGGEGSGKGTLIKNLELKFLKKEDIPYVLTREPGGTETSEEIRNVILENEMNAKTEALLFAAARSENLDKVVKPALSNNLVIFDRYIDSSFVYQSYTRGLKFEDVYNINQFATDGFLPDLTIILDIDPIIGLKRIEEFRSDEVNRLDLEGIDFHLKVREGYLSLKEKYPERIFIVDADQTEEEVYNDVIKIIEEKFKNK